LLARAIVEGLQAVRRECCDGIDFAPLLYKKVWAGQP